MRPAENEFFVFGRKIKMAEKHNENESTTKTKKTTLFGRKRKMKRKKIAEQ